MGPTLDVIQQAVTDLQKLTVEAQSQLRIIVNLQVRAASQDQLALDVLSRLSRARQYLDGRLFERDSLPLWQASQRREMGENNEFYLNASTRLLSIRSFAMQTQGALAVLGLLFLLSLFGTYHLHLRSRSMQATAPEQQEVLHFARHWIALALLPPLLGASARPFGAAAADRDGDFAVLHPYPHPAAAHSPRFRLLLYCVAVGVRAERLCGVGLFTPCTARSTVRHKLSGFSAIYFSHSALTYFCGRWGHALSPSARLRRDVLLFWCWDFHWLPNCSAT